MVLWGKGLRYLLSTAPVRGVRLSYGGKRRSHLPPCNQSNPPMVWQGDGIIKPMCSSQYIQKRATLKLWLSCKQWNLLKICGMCGFVNEEETETPDGFIMTALKAAVVLCQGNTNRRKGGHQLGAWDLSRGKNPNAPSWLCACTPYFVTVGCEV